MDPKRFASISCLFVLCQNFTLLKENEDLTEYRLHKKQPAGNRAKKCMHGKTKSSYYHHHESPSRRVPAAARLRDLDSCVRLFLSQHFFFYLTISFQFQTTNKGFSKTQQRQKTVSSGAEVRRRAHSRLLPCKVHATPLGTGYVPQALQNRCSEGTQFFFITYIFTKSVAASFGKGSQTLRDESLRCARSSAWGRPRRCNPEVKDLHHHHHHRHH